MLKQGLSIEKVLSIFLPPRSSRTWPLHSSSRLPLRGLDTSQKSLPNEVPSSIQLRIHLHWGISGTLTALMAGWPNARMIGSFPLEPCSLVKCLHGNARAKLHTELHDRCFSYPSPSPLRSPLSYNTSSL